MPEKMPGILFTLTLYQGLERAGGLTGVEQGRELGSELCDSVGTHLCSRLPASVSGGRRRGERVANTATDEMQVK